MPKRNQKSPAADASSSAARKERLAAELRANLARRKAQSRERDKTHKKTEHGDKST